jgi:tetratricopeptide (TPR) repeat protein
MVKIITCGLLVLSFLNISSGQTNPTYHDLLRSGSAHFQAGELEAALADVNKSIELNPRNVDAYVLRILVRNKQNPDANHLEDLDKIIELAPSAPATEGYYVARSNYRARRLQWNDALDDMNKAVALNPETPQNYNFRSYIYLMKGDLGQARADYEKGLKLNPALPSPFVRRAYAYCQARHFDVALADYDKAIEWKADYAEAYADRGIVHGLMGNINAAIKDIKQAAALNPQSISDRIPEQSFTSPFWELNTFIKVNPAEARAYQLLGFFRLLQQKEQDAANEFRKALDLEPALKAEIDRISAVLHY